MQLTGWENANNMHNAKCAGTKTSMEWPYCSFLYCDLMLTFFVWHFLIDSPSFLFLPHFVLCICLVFLVILCNTIYISLFTLCFDEVHLIGFYFVTWCFCINSYKNTRGFPRPPTTNSQQRAFARNVDFSFIVSGSERTFTFCVSLNVLPTLATLVRDILVRII